MPMAKIKALICKNTLLAITIKRVPNILLRAKRRD